MSTIKTKYGYFIISNTYVTWHFYEQSSTSAMTAYIDGDITALDSLSILKLDELGLMTSTNWPHEVTNAFTLRYRLKRDRLAAERESKGES